MTEPIETEHDFPVVIGQQVSNPFGESPDRVKVYPPHPQESAGFLNWLLFHWTSKLMTVGAEKTLTLADVIRAPVADTPEDLHMRMSKSWEREVQRKGIKDASLLAAALHAFGAHYAIYGLCTFLETAMMMFIPFALSRVVKVLAEKEKTTDGERYGWASAIVGANIVLSLLHHHTFFGLHRFGYRIVVAIQTQLYVKVTKLSPSALEQLSTGLIMNVMGSDLVRIQEALLFPHFVWAAFLCCGVCFYIMYAYLELAALAGFAAVLILIPIQMFTTTAFAKLRRQISPIKDARVKHINEIVAAIRLVKMYTWEPAFALVVNKLRLKEIGLITKTNYMSSSIFAFGFVTPMLISLVMFVTYEATGGVLTSEKVYGTLAFVYPTRLFVAYFAPSGVRGLVEINVVFKRVESVLKASETHRRVAGPEDSAKGGSVGVDNATMGWDTSSFSLRDITFSVAPGEVVAIIGKVGSGKSTMLQLVLGEAQPTVGTVHVTGSVAYVSQVPWILTDTARNNIVFGRAWDPEWYKIVVRACALARDFQMWPQRDATFIGERGVTLSGGQKARLSLARAVYGKADVYLLDDPFSAVDVMVGRHIFTHVIGRLLKDCAVVLVTHQQQYLREVTRVVVLDAGRVRNYGVFEEVSSELQELDCLKDDSDTEGTATTTRSAVENDPHDEVEAPATGQVEEDKGVGAVTWATYKEYILITLGTSSTLLAIATWTVVVLAPQVMYLVSDWWLSVWSDTKPENRSGDYHMKVYGLLVAGTVVVSFLRNAFITHRMTGAARTLHDRMFKCLLRAPTLFFDQTPNGRVLNRFSQDLAIVDEQFQIVVMDLLQGGANTLGQVALVCALNPWLFIPIVPISVTFVWLRGYYIRTQREVKRLQGSTRSPIYSHFGETLQGLCTLRSFHAEDAFITKLNHLINEHQKVNYMFLTSARWLGIRLDCLCILFLTATVFFAVSAVSSIPTGSVGVSLLYVVQLLSSLQWTVRQSAEAEGFMTSVERVLAYTHLPAEAEPVLETDKLIPSTWPSDGTVTFHSTSLRYVPDGALVLKGVSVVIPSAFKVGVVGRTGAGKSTLLAALFRLTELSGGDIVIDGVDCSKVGLRRLRGAFCVIPQEPLLFTATVASNLDPFGQSTESELWRVLAQAQLAEHVRSLDGGLQHMLSEGGGNFSVGQRQLVCLARALLRDAKILVMDEATASVDFHTDSVIQQCIRDCFTACTVITVAHRLDTIIESDRIMVLDAGALKEFDTPHALLSDPDSVFASLVEETGPVHCGRLRALAEAKYKKTLI